MCIAKQESNYDTSSIGRLNVDGSEDHGIFQISHFWCSIEGQGKGCNMACSELVDSDITNDVECMLKIHEEHNFLSGDGFNAWTTYPRCKDQSEEYIRGCFNENFIQNVRPGIFQPVTLVYNPIQKTPLTTITQSTRNIEHKTTTEKYYFNTVPQETTTHAQNSISKVVTEKPFKSLLNSLQKSTNDGIRQQQQQQFKNIANNKSPSSSSVFKSLGSNAGTILTKINKENMVDGQKIQVLTTTTSKPSTSSTLRISQTTTTTPRYLKSSTVINKKSTTRKSSTVKSTSLKTRSKPSSFDIFAFYLNDYTSKRPSINYKPIEFDSKKSTVIINNKSKNSLQPKVFQQVEKSSSTPQRTTTTTPKYSVFNNLLSNVYDGTSQNRIGRVVGNITPHSIDYLLKITTPRTFYG